MCSRPDGWIPDRTLNATSRNNVKTKNKPEKVNRDRITRMDPPVKLHDRR